MANNQTPKLRAFVRIDGTGRVVPGAPIFQANKPKVGTWREIPLYYRGVPTSSTTSTTTTVNPSSTSTTTTTTTAASVPFIITVDTTGTSGAARLPYADGNPYTGTINWGDSEITANSYATREHTYASPGVYQITITGNIPYWNTSAVSNNMGACLTSINQFGDFHPSSLNGAFSNCGSLTSLAGDLNLTGYTSLYRTFAGTGNITSNLNTWDVSGITEMSELFADSDFNGDISSWDTGSVTSMAYMFSGNNTFNGVISGWDVSNVTNMGYMFFNASAFNKYISGWNVSNVTNFQNFLSSATSFTTTTLDALYNGWATLPSLKTNVTFTAFACHTSASDAARATLTGTYNWTISDGGACA